MPVVCFFCFFFSFCRTRRAPHHHWTRLKLGKTRYNGSDSVENKLEIVEETSKVVQNSKIPEALAENKIEDVFIGFGGKETLRYDETR